MSTLIITHWDTDGVISAAILSQNLKGKIDYFVSNIGSYTIDPKKIKKINGKEYDEIFIVDYALQKEVVSKLKSRKIMVIDHHFIKRAKGVKYHNPILNGASYDDYPCTVAVLNEYLKKELVLESCIGAVGDKEQSILKNKKFLKKINTCKRKYNIDFNDMYKIKNLMDSSYMLGKKSEIIRTIKLIKKQGVLAVLKDKKLNLQLKKIQNEKKKLMKTKPKKLGKHILFYELKSKYNLLSTITRDLSKKNPEKIIVTYLKPNAYIRRDKINIDLKPLIDLGQKKGWNIGGKHEVCGINGCNKKILKEVINYMISF